MSEVRFPKEQVLFLLLGAFFITNALMAEFIGVKIFSLERSLGLSPLELTLFGQTGLSFNLTAGVLLWPFVFVFTDIINEYFGTKGVRLLSFLAVGMIVYAFMMVSLSIGTVPADFWPASHISPESTALETEVGNLNTAYRLIFGQGLWIIIGSMVAFLVGQLADVTVFHAIKRRFEGGSLIWRSTGSTLVSQFIDSYIVLFIAFYIGGNWPLGLVLAVGTVNYLFKFCMALIMIPFLAFLHRRIERWLGPELAEQMRRQAAN